MVNKHTQSVIFMEVMIALLGLLLAVSAAGQQNMVPLQLSFSDPGARSMGFGGAFVALADDATAAFANPAGLTQLLRPEISIEARGWSYSTPYTVGGRVEGVPSGNGLDSTAGLRIGTSEYDTAGVSFLAFAYPKDKWSFAAYRHEYADLEFTGLTQGLFGGGTDCCQIRWWDQQWSSRMEIIGYGLSSAYRGNDRFDIGLSAVFYDATLDARVSEYLWDADTDEAFYAENSYLPERWVRSEHLFVDSTDWTFNVGILWRLTESWSLGGVYREGFDGEIGARVTAGVAIDFGVPPGEVFFSIDRLRIEFPDIYGFGLSYQRPDGRLTLSFQWDRVEYSNIPASLRLDDQTIDDTDELHLGAEYVFLESTPIIALRVGTWYEPDHQMQPTIDDVFLRAVIPRPENDLHYAAGIGIAMERFQVDLSVDVADRVDTISLSAILNF